MNLMLSTVKLRRFVYSELLTGEAQIWQAWELSQARSVDEEGVATFTRTMTVHLGLNSSVLSISG